MKWVSVLPGLLLAGCASSAPPSPPLRDFRGIIHCHSLYSHDSKGTYEEILAAAKAAKVDFVVMTDHPPDGDPGLSLREGWKGIRDGVLFIQGHELAGANLLAIGIREPVRGKTPSEKIADIHRQGGLAIVSHPEEVKDWEPYLTADGMEIYNVHAAFTRLRKNPAKLAAALKAVKEDPERSFMHLQELDPAVLATWDEINRTRRFVGIAGNDSHQNVNILGLQLDPYPRAFKFVSTHVLAQELTESAVLDSLREGRCYVEFELGRPWKADGHDLSWLGAEVNGQGRFPLPVHGRNEFDGEPILVRDGQKVVHPHAGPWRLSALTVDSPGVHRIEFHRDDRIWMILNPVRSRRP